MTLSLNTVPSVLDAVQPVINLGYNIVGNLLGNQTDFYRASGPNNPITDLNHYDLQSVLFSTTPDFSMTKPRDYKSTQRYASFDRANAKVGDYLVDQVTSLTYFINSLESITPDGIIYCNETISFYRPTSTITGGYISNAYVNKTKNTYGGNVDNLGQPLAMNWPCSMLIGTKGERAMVNIPNETRIPWYLVKLPIIPGVIPETNDLILSGNRRRFLLSSVETTDLGLNLSLDEVTL